MGRLTEKNAYWLEEEFWTSAREPDDEQIDAVYMKLKEYEDLEEQVLKSTGTDLASMVGEFMHYYNLKKENRLLELPCKVGDTVYSLTPFCEICERFFDISYACEDCNPSEFATETKFDYEMIPMFGKSVFLTKEEAEKALEEMEK